MARSDRLLALVQILRRHRRPVTADVMARELEVSVRTIYRDIATLAASQVPVRGEAGMGYVLEPGFDLPPMMFTPDELEAILLGLRWLRQRADPAMTRASDDAVAKIGAVLPDPLKPVLFDSALYVPHVGPPVVSEQVDMAPLREAIRKEHKITIDYCDGQGQQTSRIIWPFGLAYFDAVRMVMAWCEKREAFRHFRTDRIAGLNIGGRYPVRRKELMRRWEREEYQCLQERIGENALR